MSDLLSQCCLMRERFDAIGGYVTVSVMATESGPRLELAVGQDQPGRAAIVSGAAGLSLGLRRALLAAAIETEFLENAAAPLLDRL